MENKIYWEDRLWDDSTASWWIHIFEDKEGQPNFDKKVTMYKDNWKDMVNWKQKIYVHYHSLGMKVEFKKVDENHWIPKLKEKLEGMEVK